MFKRIGKFKYDFLEEDLNNTIKERQKILNDMIKNWEIKENLGHSIEENLEKNRIWLLWEHLFKTFIWWILNNDLTWWFDIITKDWLKIDIKTIKTNKTLNSDTLNKYNFYLQYDQLKDDILYCPIFINENEKEFAIYFNTNMLGSFIKSNFNPIFQNPPFTKTKEKIKNYVIPYLRIYN